MTGEERVTGSVTGLLEGGTVTLELMENADTGERVLSLTAEMEGGTLAELVLGADEAVDIATDLLLFAQQCRNHNEGGAA